MESISHLEVEIRQSRSGMLTQVISSPLIAVILIGYWLWLGHQMASLLLRGAKMEPCKYGVPLQANLFSPIKDILMQWMLWHGHQMGSRLLRGALTRQSRSGMLTQGGMLILIAGI